MKTQRTNTQCTEIFFQLKKLKIHQKYFDNLNIFAQNIDREYMLESSDGNRLNFQNRSSVQHK